MPIYAYRCEDCGFEKDVLQKFSDAPLVDCPKCQHPAFHRMITAPTFQLKGTGWYVTDFRDGDRRPQGKGNGHGHGHGHGGEAAASSDGAATDSGAGKSTASDAASTSDTSGSSAAPAS